MLEEKDFQRKADAAFDDLKKRLLAFLKQAQPASPPAAG